MTDVLPLSYTIHPSPLPLLTFATHPSRLALYYLLRAHSKIGMKWTPANGKRKPGRPSEKTWRRKFHEDFAHTNITWKEAETVASE